MRSEMRLLFVEGTGSSSRPASGQAKKPDAYLIPVNIAVLAKVGVSLVGEPDKPPGRFVMSVQTPPPISRWRPVGALYWRIAPRRFKSRPPDFSSRQALPRCRRWACLLEIRLSLDALVGFNVL